MYVARASARREAALLSAKLMSELTTAPATHSLTTPTECYHSIDAFCAADAEHERFLKFLRRDTAGCVSSERDTAASDLGSQPGSQSSDASICECSSSNCSEDNDYDRFFNSDSPCKANDDDR